MHIKCIDHINSIILKFRINLSILKFYINSFIFKLHTISFIFFQPYKLVQNFSGFVHVYI